ncbi:hypothetical protein ACC848_38890, partial [Rhizobium johnstonii]
ISSDAPLLRPTTEFLAQAATQTGDLSSFNHYFFERLLQEMLVGVLVDSSRSAPTRHTVDVFTTALSIIAAQSSDPALRAAGVAREVNLSLRQLER